MKKLTINRKKYDAKAFDFGLVCDLEDMGVELIGGQSKNMSLFRAYCALCMGEDVKTAEKELNEHLKNGGKIKELMEIMGEEMNKSDFFQALNAESEEIAAQEQTAEESAET